MPNPSILHSMRGRMFGLGHKNEPIFNDEARKGLADAQPTVLSIARKQLTTAQVLALNGTPIEVIAAPGAGYTIVVDHVLFFLDYNSATYVAGAGEDLSLKYTNGSGDRVCRPVDSLDFIVKTADAMAMSPGMLPLSTQGIVLLDNAAVVAHMESGEVATGNSPVFIHAYYRVIPSSLTA